MASSKTLSEKDPAAARESLQRAGNGHDVVWSGDWPADPAISARVVSPASRRSGSS